MTDVASEIPVQRQETAADTEPQDGPGAMEQLGERVGDAVDRAGEAVARAGEAVERTAATSARIASQVVDRVRNTAEFPADRGATSIADEVVEKIAGIAARDVPGVYDLGGDVARFFASVKERVGMADSAEDADRGISVRLDGATAAIDVTLVLEYGFVVHSVTEKVRTKVITAVENLLGLEVLEVNIRVDDIHVEDTGPVGDDETRAADYQI